jgi:hypothetical protein
MVVTRLNVFENVTKYGKYTSLKAPTSHYEESENEESTLLHPSAGPDLQILHPLECILNLSTTSFGGASQPLLLQP